MEPGSDTRSNREFTRLGWQASLLTCTNKKRCSHFAAFCNEHHAPQPVDMKTHWQVQQHSKHLVEGLYRWFCRGGSTGSFDWGSGGGGGQTLVRKGLLNFLWQITSPHIPSHQSRLHVIIPWPPAMYCVASRGKQIIGGYPKAIKFLIILGI